MSLTLIGCGSKKAEVENVIQVSAPVDGKSAVGESYENIYRKFKSAGFTNINVDEVEDVSEDDQRGTIKEIEIKGDNSFKKKDRSEEHTSELQSHLQISYAVFCLKKKTFLMIRRPPRSTLFPSRRSSDLVYQPGSLFTV